MFEKKSENRNFLKNKLKNLFLYFEVYSFHKVEKIFGEAESIALI